MSDQDYPHGTNLKLQHVDGDTIGWAHEGPNGELLSSHSKQLMDKSQWTIIERLPQAAKAEEESNLEKSLREVSRLMTDCNDAEKELSDHLGKVIVAAIQNDNISMLNLCIGMTVGRPVTADKLLVGIRNHMAKK